MSTCRKRPTRRPQKRYRYDDLCDKQEWLSLGVSSFNESKCWLTWFSPSLQTAERAGNCFGCRKREGPCHSVGHGVPAKLSAGFAAAANAGHHAGGHGGSHPHGGHGHYNGYPLNGSAAAAAAAAASVVGYYHGGGGWGNAPVPTMNKS